MPTALATDFARPVVLQVGRIGDQLLALPAIRALAALFPGRLRLLLVGGMLSFYYRGLPVGDPVRVRCDDGVSVQLDGRGGDIESCDLFLSLSRHPYPFITTLARQMGATKSVGICTSFGEQVRLPPGAHVFDQFFAIPQMLEPSLPFARFCERPRFSPAAEAAAARLAASLHERADRVLFLHPETRPDRMWSTERLGWVLGCFLAERPEYVVVVSSRAPFDVGVDDARVIWIDLHLELACALIGHADLFLGVDSCFLHAADLFRIPGVGLFGPTEPREWGFRLSPRARHVAGASMDHVRREPVLQALLDLAESVDAHPRELKGAARSDSNGPLRQPRETIR